MNDIKHIFKEAEKLKLEDTLWTDNKDNLTDYSIRSSDSYKQQKDSDRIQNKITNTNWKNEATYFNYTKGRIILKMNNKEWHKLTKYKYAR